MKQNGEFRDEAGGEELISEFYSRDYDGATEDSTDYEARRRIIRKETATDWEDRAFRWVMNDVQYMKFESFVRLQAELIENQRRRAVYLDVCQEL